VNFRHRVYTIEMTHRSADEANENSVNAFYLPIGISFRMAPTGELEN